MTEVAISLGLAFSLESALSRHPQSREILRRDLSRRAEEILEILGVPGQVSVELHAFEPGKTAESRFLCVTINEQLCRYSDELLQLVYSYVSSLTLGPGLEPTEILDWLNAEPNRDKLVEFLTLACLEIIKKQPGLLLTRPQVDAYIASLPLLAGDRDFKLKPDWVLPVLRAVLALRISIADKLRVAQILQQGVSEEKSQQDIVEDLIVKLRPDIIEIHLAGDYLREITTTDDESSRKQFSLMRDSLFYELGLRYPDFRFVPVENLKPNSFAFKINHLITPPRIGLSVGQYLINDTRDRLRSLDIPAESAVNPANFSECAIIDSVFRRKAEADYNLITWDQIGFLVLSFAADLKENSGCFLDRQITQNHLGQLEQAFPELVKAAQAKISAAEQLTRVLRDLVAEDISIRNLRAILELIIDCDYIIADPHKYIIFDDRVPTARQPDERWEWDPANVVAFVRAGLKRYIGYKFARGENTLVVYLLDPKIEELLLRQVLQDDQLERTQLHAISEAVRKAINSRRSTASIPPILTTIDLRPVFRHITAAEFPRLSVLAYQELSPELNIQPIARITL